MLVRASRYRRLARRQGLLRGGRGVPGPVIRRHEIGVGVEVAQARCRERRSLADYFNSAFLLSRVVDRKREDGKNPPATDELESRYSIRAFPTLVVATQNGRAIARLDGYPGRNSLLRFLQESSRKTP